MLALNLDCSRAYNGNLEVEGVIQRPEAYLRYLRRERRQSPSSEADADFQRAKSELIRLRIAEKQRQLIPLDEAVGYMDEVVRLFISRLSGFAARCGGRDLAARRAIDQAVYDLRLEISDARPSWRICTASRHWMTTHDDRRDDRRRSRGSDRARRPLH